MSDPTFDAESVSKTLADMEKLMKEVRAGKGAITEKQLERLESLLSRGYSAEQAAVGQRQRAKEAEAKLAAAQVQLSKGAGTSQKPEQAAAPPETQLPSATAPPPVIAAAGGMRNPTPAPSFNGDVKSFRDFDHKARLWAGLNHDAFGGDQKRLVMHLVQGFSGHAQVWLQSWCKKTGFAGDVFTFPFSTVRELLHEWEQAHPGPDETSAARRRIESFLAAEKGKGRKNVRNFVRGFRALQLNLPGITEDEQAHAFRGGLANLSPALVSQLAANQSLKLPLTELMALVEEIEAAVANTLPVAPAPRGDPMQIDHLKLDLEDMSVEDMQAEILHLWSSGNGQSRGQSRRGDSQPKGKGKGQGKGQGKAQGQGKSPGQGKSKSGGEKKDQGDKPKLRLDPSLYSPEQIQTARARLRAGRCMNCDEQGHIASECQVPGLLRSGSEE
jgi:hypothetical protein